MARVTGIREVRLVAVAANPDVVGFRKGPVMTRTRRIVREVPRDSWASLMNFRVTLPLHCGAGPSGTYARRCIPDHRVARNRYWGRSPLAWSIEALLLPLRSYYATYVPPMHFGPKSGPRGRCAA